MSRSTILIHHTVSAYHKQFKKCFYCLIDMPDTQDIKKSNNPNYCTSEHVIPKSEGGKDIKGNIVACCRKCNTSRSTTQEDINNHISHMLSKHINIQGMSRKKQHEEYLKLLK